MGTTELRSVTEIAPNYRSYVNRSPIRYSFPAGERAEGSKLHNLLLLSPNDFLFLLLNVDTVFKNSTPEKIANI